MASVTASADAARSDPAEGLTARLVALAMPLRFDELPNDVRQVACDCLVDWLACLYPALNERASCIVAETVLDEGATPRATFVGRSVRGSLLQAALVNGTTSHALDFDDVHLHVPGHMSVAILPALLALAEDRGASGQALIAAFVAGFETACRIGRLVEPAHYANGFHATATIGSLGAAVACAHLLRSTSTEASHALAIAATQAAGLKAMFGTMAKPLHAGLASQAGLRAALLAARGFTARTDVLECRQGFAGVHGSDFDAELALAVPQGGFHILGNLFKFHAACYSTHSTIEAVAALRREHALQAESVVSIRVVVGEGCSICNIAQPETALEAKFSLRVAAAFALLDIDTSALQTWSRATDADVVAIRDRVSVELVQGMGLSDCEVTLELRNGQRLRQFHDCGEPLADKQAQSARIGRKFQALVSPVLGEPRSLELLSLLSRSEQCPDIRTLMRACAEGATQ